MEQDLISFGAVACDVTNLSGEEYLRRIEWRKSADTRIVTAAAAGDRDRFARAIRRTLTGAKEGRPLRAAVGPLLHPLWSRHAFNDVESENGGFLVALNDHVQTKRPKAGIQRCVEDALGALEAPSRTPLALVQWITVLTEIGTELAPQTLLRVWRETLDCSLSIASNVDDFALATDAAEPVDDRRLLVDGELRWRIGLCFSSIGGSGRLRKAGRSCLNAALDSLTDGDGMPHAQSLTRLPLTLAVLTRSVFAGEIAGRPLWRNGSARRFSSLVNRTAALCHADGRIALSNGASFAPASLLRSASLLAGTSRNEPAAQSLLNLPDDAPSRRCMDRKSQQVRRGRLRLGFNARNSPASQSDWAELACLRNNWWEGADRCVIAYHQSPPQLSLTAFDRLVLEGAWPLEASLDAIPVDCREPWRCVCWFSDKDVDYMELQQEAGEATFYRHVLLSRTDHWLFLADAATVSEPRSIELTMRLPLAEGVKVDSGRWTRELSLSRKKLKAAIYPLGLDQQRVVHAHGSLQEEAGFIQLQQRTTGTAVHVPLVMDWSPGRRSSPAQWRRLTVAEDGATLRNDVAAGYRLRIGKHQWLFYRSFRPGQTARSVLGHHTPHETVIAEFTGDGEVEPLVIVE